MANFPRYPSKAHSSGQARIRLAGKQVYLGLFNSPESWHRYRELLTQHSAGLPSQLTERLTVAEVLATWFAEEVPRRFSSSSREPEQFRRSVKPLRELFAELPAADFGPRALRQVQQRMIESKLCRNVVNRRICRIKTLFRWAESVELVPRGSYHGLATVPCVPRNLPGVKLTERVKPAPWEAVKAVARELLPAPQAMLLLQWWSGMRTCEVRIMRTMDLDTSGPVWTYRPATHKNSWRGQERVIPLGPRCQALLRRWLRPDAPETFLFCPVSHRRRHNHYTERAYCHAVRRACSRAGVQLHPYQLRHAAKLRIERALGTEAARAILGHASINTTQLYGGLDLQTALAAALKLG